MNLIELQPDDVLVLRCPHVLNREQQASLRGAMQLVLGSEQRVMVLDGGQEIDVIRVTLVGKVETNHIVRPADDDAAFIAAAKDAGYAGAEIRHAQREVQHVDTDEPEAEGIPPHVWLYRNMLTDLQAVAPLGRDETNGQYAVAIDDLTDEQMRVPHVLKQLDELKGAG